MPIPVFQACDFEILGFETMGRCRTACRLWFHDKAVLGRDVPPHGVELRGRYSQPLPMRPDGVGRTHVPQPNRLHPFPQRMAGLPGEVDEDLRMYPGFRPGRRSGRRRFQFRPGRDTSRRHPREQVGDVVEPGQHGVLRRRLRTPAGEQGADRRLLGVGHPQPQFVLAGLALALTVSVLSLGAGHGPRSVWKTVIRNVGNRYG